jgi:hypothetical protein
LPQRNTIRFGDANIRDLSFLRAQIDDRRIRRRRARPLRRISEKNG